MVANSRDLDILMDCVYIIFLGLHKLLHVAPSLYRSHSIQITSATHFIGMRIVLELGKVVMLDAMLLPY
jgi:hypothetical protein